MALVILTIASSGLVILEKRQRFCLQVRGSVTVLLAGNTSLNHPAKMGEGIMHSTKIVMRTAKPGFRSSIMRMACKQFANE